MIRHIEDEVHVELDFPDCSMGVTVRRQGRVYICEESGCGAIEAEHMDATVEMAYGRPNGSEHLIRFSIEDHEHWMWEWLDTIGVVFNPEEWNP